MWFYLFLAKLTAKVSRLFLNRSGSTWPGELVYRLFPKVSQRLRPYFKRIIVVIGTNGKTSTCKFLTNLLKNNGYLVISNPSGANLLNGIVSTVLIQLPFLARKAEYYGVFEVDEFASVEVIKQFKPETVIILNVFRDQLDRYGEVQNVLDRWQKILSTQTSMKIIYLEADPALSSLVKSLPNKNYGYFVPQKYLKKRSSIAGDYLYCQKCGRKLTYSSYYLGHLGAWQCSHCSLGYNHEAFVFKSNELLKLNQLPDYFVINLQAVFLLLKDFNIPEAIFWQTAKDWRPAFGRSEIFTDNLHQYHFYLGKNPASWTSVLCHLHKNSWNNTELILGLNNRVPDGHDVSWIYDADFIYLPKEIRISVFGDRGYDLAVRLKINQTPAYNVFLNLKQLRDYLQDSQSSRVIFLANYSALLELRQLIIGRSLL